MVKGGWAAENSDATVTTRRVCPHCPPKQPRSQRWSDTAEGLTHPPRYSKHTSCPGSGGRRWVQGWSLLRCRGGADVPSKAMVKPLWHRPHTSLPGIGESHFAHPHHPCPGPRRAGAPVPVCWGARPAATAVGPVENDPTFRPAEQLCG